MATPSGDSAPLTWPDRLFAPGPKRILAIDGGGVRGALAIGILQRLEAVLRAELGRPDLVLADYFDLIGGTSTGAIIAAGLALGRDTDYLERVYRTLGPRVFRRGALRLPLIQARFDPRGLERMIRQEVGEGTLSTSPWRTGFAAIAKRVDTGSAWVFTNCTKARFWEGDPEEMAREPDPAKRITIANKEFPAARVVQASAAAPFFFDLVPVEIERGKPGVFFDGAITPHGNPALQLAMAALIPSYGFSWKPGADNLLIVSVGTGATRPRRPDWVERRQPAIWKAMAGLMSMSHDSSQLAITTLQWLGRSPQPWRINSEIGGAENALPGIEPLWTFLRYDAPLDPRWIKQTLERDYTSAQLAGLLRLDDDSQIPGLLDIGQEAGRRLVKPEHFPAAFRPS